MGSKKIIKQAPWADRLCDDCKFKTWCTDKSWNYSIEDHKPLTLKCKFADPSDGHIVRGSKACYKFESL